MTTPTRRRKPSNRCASWSRATRFCSQIIGSAVERRRPVSQFEEGAATIRSDRRLEIHRSQELPLDDGFNPNYQSEGRIYGQYILKNHPNAKIGILYQNDDLGRDYVTGLKEALGAKAASMIVAETSYELTDPTIDSQIVKLKAAGADLLYDASTPKFAAQAIKEVADLGWKPVHILDINAGPVSATLTRWPRHFKGHHLDQLRQGPGRSAVEGRSRHQGLFRLHGQILS